MKIRLARIADADGMSDVLQEIIKFTGRVRPSKPAFVISSYIDNPSGIRCSIAVDENQEILGFQSLTRAMDDNRYGVPVGWGIIGTHIRPRAHRKGIGTALFHSSKQAAQEAGVQKIDAYIGADTPAALRYYESLGFRTYHEQDGIVQKVFLVDRVRQP